MVILPRVYSSDKVRLPMEPTEHRGPMRPTGLAVGDAEEMAPEPVDSSQTCLVVDEVGGRQLVDQHCR